MTVTARDMIAAFWDYLNSREAYRALGFREFRKYDGRELMAVEAGRDLAFMADDLPAHATQAIAIKPRIVNEPGRVMQVVTLTQTMVCLPDGELGDSINLDRAVQVILNEIYRPAARANGLDGSGRLAKAEIEFEETFQPVHDAGNLLIYWMATYRVELWRGMVAS